jgi:hypothetical protein
MEIHRRQGGLVGSMVEKDGRHRKKIPTESVETVMGYGFRDSHYSLTSNPP